MASELSRSVLFAAPLSWVIQLGEARDQLVLDRGKVHRTRKKPLFILGEDIQTIYRRHRSNAVKGRNVRPVGRDRLQTRECMVSNLHRRESRLVECSFKIANASTQANL